MFDHRQSELKTQFLAFQRHVAVEFPRRQGPAGNAGIVDQDRRGSECFLALTQATRDVCLARDLSDDSDSTAIFGHVAGVGFVAIEDDDAGPGGREAAADRCADPLPAPGNNRDLSVESIELADGRHGVAPKR